MLADETPSKSVVAIVVTVGLFHLIISTSVIPFAMEAENSGSSSVNSSDLLSQFTISVAVIPSAGEDENLGSDSSDLLFQLAISATVITSAGES